MWGGKAPLSYSLRKVRGKENLMINSISERLSQILLDFFKINIFTKTISDYFKLWSSLLFHFEWLLLLKKKEIFFFFKEEKVFEKEGLLTPPIPSVKK